MSRRNKYASARHIAGKMNKTEAEYLLMLKATDPRHRHICFEDIVLVLGARCRYSPDFTVVAHDGILEFHEVKGAFIHDDGSLIKIRAAAEKFPYFRFILAQKKKGGWDIKHIPPRTAVEAP